VRALRGIDPLELTRRIQPLSPVSIHPFFFNEAYDPVDKTNVPFTGLEMGHDAWIGGCYDYARM